MGEFMLDAILDKMYILPKMTAWRILMASYTLTDARNKHGEVFDRAHAEPVLLTKQGRPSHVILSARLYEDLTHRLAELEDQLLGERAKDAIASEGFIGAEKFSQELRKMIDGQR